MKINNKVLSKIGNVNKISNYNTFSIINDRFLLIDYNKNKINIFNDLIDNKITFISDNEEIDMIYKNIVDKMDSTINYYFKLQDKIEEMLYPSNSFYILIINISKIYHLIDLGRFFVEQWYESKDKMIRKIPKIGRLIIDCEDCEYEYFINILSSLYKENIFIYDNINYYNLYDYEKYCFLGLISIISLIKGDNIEDVTKLISYVENTYNILLKEYEYYQKNNQAEFKEEDDNI